MSHKWYYGIAIGLAVVIAVCVASLSWLKATPSAEIDPDLAKVIKQFNLQPLQVRKFEADQKFKLGQALFFDPVLSGPRDVACGTCHLLKYGTSDGLSKSIGVHGVEIGPERRLMKPVRQHPRHALKSWNRDNNAVRALFWDGRVEVINSERRVFRSPLGNDLPTGLENILAVQALFPLVTTEEMLGEAADRSSTNLPNEHAGLLNELARIILNVRDFPHGKIAPIAHDQIARRRFSDRVAGEISGFTSRRLPRVAAWCCPVPPVVGCWKLTQSSDTFACAGCTEGTRHPRAPSCHRYVFRADVVVLQLGGCCIVNGNHSAVQISPIGRLPLKWKPVVTRAGVIPFKPSHRFPFISAPFVTGVVARRIIETNAGREHQSTGHNIERLRALLRRYRSASC